MPGRGSARKRSSASAARRGRGRGSRRSAAGPTTRQAANVTVTSSAAGSASSPVNSAPHFDLAQMLELVRAEVAAEFQAHQQIASGTPQQPRPQPATSPQSYSRESRSWIHHFPHSLQCSMESRSGVHPFPRSLQCHPWPYQVYSRVRAWRPVYYVISVGQFIIA